MKTKSDFITNSSSTSFIIALKDKKEDLSEINYTTTINLLDALLSTSIRSIDDLNKNLEKNDDGYDKIKSIIENGGIAYILEASSEDDNVIGYDIHRNGFDINKLENKNLIYERMWE